jgi:hypothetical protein
MGIVEIVIKYCRSFLNDLPGRAIKAQLEMMVANIEMPTAQLGKFRFPKK